MCAGGYVRARTAGGVGARSVGEAADSVCRQRPTASFAVGLCVRTEVANSAWVVRGRSVGRRAIFCGVAALALVITGVWLGLGRKKEF